LLLAPLLGFAPRTVYGADQRPTRILLIVSERAAIYEDFAAQVVRGLRTAMVELAPPVILTPAELASSIDSTGHFPRVDLIIPVGTWAAEAVASYSTSIPVYFTLIPKTTYQHLTARFAQNFGPDRPYSALYLDQPLPRKLALVHFGLPSARRIGVILGPSTRALREPLKAAARSVGLELVVREVGSRRGIQPALEALLRQSDAILALPDPGIYNRITIRNILITSFRYRKPVIGYSASFVKAGALMAVYSSPEQISAEVAQRLAPALKPPGTALPPAHSPDTYSVDVNYWVADSLGIPVPQRDAIQNALKQLQRMDGHD
jgi:ABC-type uncharacterized transport system substrate-binding protein